MKRSSVILLQILTGIYWLLYLLGFSDWTLDVENWNSEQMSVHFLMLLFTIGFALTFIRLDWAGLTLQLWHFLIWVFALSIWTDAGMILLLAAPVLALGVFLFYFGLAKSRFLQPYVKIKWKVILQSLMINYVLIALLATFVGPNRSADFNLWAMPMLIIPIFSFALIGLFILSWTKKFLAGILLIVWYFLAGVFRFEYPQVPNQEGPILLFGFPILVQGILYVIYSRKFKKQMNNKMSK